MALHFQRQTQGPSFSTNGFIIKRSCLGNVEKEFSVNKKKKKKKKEKEFRLCLVTVFIFYFQKLVFGNINNFFFCIFEIKNMFC